MPIRPIDMQVAIPKLSEVSRMSHLEQQKAGLQQNQNAVAGEKANQREHHTVNEANRDEKSRGETDPRREGKNKYAKNKGKNKQQQKGKNPAPDSYHKIDIRI